MDKHAGIARFTYNWGLATWQSLYLDCAMAKISSGVNFKLKK
ncbi:MAG: helix-turn-helix domain-containing protein [Rhizonema sp. PD37]|nr:helix-turn-helix domain-containing protein [Rhizonema sp. PD37]